MKDYRFPSSQVVLHWVALAAVAIVFFSGAIARGEEPRRLTNDGRIKSSPVFTDRSGTELMFVVQERAVQMRLVRLKLADLSIVSENPNQTKTEFEPALSPDGRVLAFVESRGNLSLALVIREQGGTKDGELPPAGGFSGARSPAITPDGTRVLFSLPAQGRQRIYSVNLAGGDRQTIIDSDGINNWPDVSFDGRRLVFASTRDDDYEIYTAGADGADVTRLTRSPRQDIRPRFSPDGSRIAFTSNRDGNYEIYVMNSDGTAVTRVTDHPERDDYPAWDPDGKHLVIVSERDGRQDLYLVAAP